MKTFNFNNNNNNSRPNINPHFVILGIILFVFILAVIRLLIWNRGVASEYDPNEDTSEFDVETEDFIMYLDQKYLEGREDDGITTVMLLGNEAFASERGDNSIAAKLEKALPDSKVYNCAFKQTTMSAKNSVYDEDYTNDAFSLYWLCKTLTLQDFTLLDNSIEDFRTKDKNADATLATLRNMDMKQVDVLAIMYDGTDYLEDRIITSPYDLEDIGTCSGSLKQSLNMLRESFPHIRIVVLSPAFACMVDQGNNYLPGSTTRTKQNNYALSDYMIAYKNVAVECSVSFIDNYNGTITEENYKKCLSDNIILNEKGRTMIADRLAKFLGNDSH